MKLGRTFLLATISAAVLVASDAQAQTYPDKPVRIIVPLAAGGGVDIVTRALTGKLGEYFPQPFVVENRPGAFTNIGSTAAANSAPDGYTLLMASPANTVNGSLYTDLPYDMLEDFTGVSRIAYGPLVLVVNPEVPAKSVPELIALAKSQPGKLSYASSGNGSSQHLAGELLRVTAGIETTHVSYKGGAPAITDLIGGRITFMMTNTLEVLPHIKAGRLRALATAGRNRSHVLPDIPTFAEVGYPDFEATVWWGVVAPAGTPKEVVSKLNEKIVQAMETPELQDRFKGMGAEIVASSPEEFNEFLETEVEKWAKVIKTAGIRRAD